MVLSVTASRKLNKDKTIALTLNYQMKFGTTLLGINKDLADLCKKFSKMELR